MAYHIKIAVEEVEVDGWLNDTDTAAGVLGILPITARISLWGEEIYFKIPLEMGEENARETVAVGDIAYWPQGQALCIFLGMTPISREGEVRPISPVNVVGHTEEARELLSVVKQADEIIIRR